MRYLIAMALAAFLSACGADGDPVRPSVSTGISVNSDGDVSTSTAISANSGNVSISVGL